MAVLLKSVVVLDKNPIQNNKARIGFVQLYQERYSDTTTHFIPKTLWIAMGLPNQITVTVEPGNVSSEVFEPIGEPT